MTDNHFDDPLEAQQLLVESSLPLVFETYDEAIGRGEVSPVVLVVDCEDELGGGIARGWLGDEAVDDAIAMQQSDDDQADADQAEPTTVFARALPWSTCRSELSAAFPYLASVFEEGPPDDGVLVVGVTAGGASALTAPNSAR